METGRLKNYLTDRKASFAARWRVSLDYRRIKSNGFLITRFKHFEPVAILEIRARRKILSKEIVLSKIPFSKSYRHFYQASNEFSIFGKVDKV